MTVHVEGPPGAGAGVLARRLATDLHLRVDTPAPRGEALPELLTRELTGGDRVQVHGYVTLHAFARALASHKYREPLHRWELQLLDRAALSGGGCRLLVTARPEEVAILADPREKRDDFTRAVCAHHERLLDGLREAQEWSAVPTLTLDGPRLTEEGYRQALAWVRAELWRQQDDVLHLRAHRASGTVHRPAVALVGDRYPEGGHDLRDQPGARAFVRATGSSWTLHRALSAAGIPDAYVTNWHKTGDEVADLWTLRRELERVDPETVVALGTAAGRALRRVKIPHTELTHPSHQRRFNAGAFGGYVKRLTLAVTEPPQWPPVHLLTDV